jgi:hypothetical protein
MMNAQDFAYWLHGFVELTQGQTPNPAQWKAICEHLDLIFKKVTPKVEPLPLEAKYDGDWAKFFREWRQQRPADFLGPLSGPVTLTC